MVLRKLDGDFSVCHLQDIAQADLRQDFTFLSRTDDELSLVCPSRFVPTGAFDVRGGWQALKIEGVLDFSLVGILAGISGVLAEHGISIFAISTFNTDYILLQKDRVEQAVSLLQGLGYTTME